MMASLNFSKVSLEIKCTNLRNKDTFSNSDPMAVVFLRSSMYSVFTEIGRTEVQRNNLNPHFKTQIELVYFFEECQDINIQLYDEDSKSKDLSAHDFLGEIETTLGNIVSSGVYRADLAKRNTTQAEIKEKKYGSISVRVHELSAPSFRCRVDLAAKQLDKKDFMGKSDPYCKVFLQHPSLSSDSLVIKTEILKKNLNPDWKEFQFEVDSAINDCDVLFEVFDWDKNSADDLIGKTKPVPLHSLVPGQEHPLIHPKKVSKKKYSNSGILQVLKFDMFQVPTFFQYIQGGCKLNFSVAIDFTASNGSPADPNSLHYNDSSRPNQYVQALTAVGKIVQDYDSDRMFPALGFGARMPDETISFNFNLNGTSNPFCHGIDGILGAYYETLKHITLAGPTNFQDIIRHGISITNMPPLLSQSEQFYNILLIVTDGIISDLQNTIDAIVDASEFPLSIVIVGVGNSDFTTMEKLDGDREPLRHRNGNIAKRDIVQFVPFAKFANTSADRLAAAVLSEFPKTLVDFMLSKGIRPNPPIGAY